MILIDVGNTNIHCLIRRKKTKDRQLILPNKLDIAPKIKALLTRYPKENVLVCSVVPKITKIFQTLKKTTQQKIFILGADLKVPIKNHYNPSNVGIDRLVVAYAAKQLYPKTRIIIDFGTATTCDFLTVNGEYLGGLILPGIGSSLKVLSSCALLPNRIALKKEPKLNIPKNTVSSLSLGISLGFALMINGLIDKYTNQLKLNNTNSQIIITGGAAKFILSRLNFKHIYHSDLIFKGLSKLFPCLP